MPYREDIGAAHAKVEQLTEQKRELEEKNRALQEELARARAAPTSPPRARGGPTVAQQRVHRFVAAAASVPFVIGLAFAVLAHRRPPPIQVIAQPPIETDEAPPAAQTLSITDTVVGTGPEVSVGDKVTTRYRGALLDGTEFDSSDGHGPFSFVVGAGRVIKGWDIGVVGMRVGGKRHLVIPPTLAYGAKKVNRIPRNSTLVFDVEVVSSTPPVSSAR